MIEAAQRMGHLVRDLLDFSRVATGSGRPENSEFQEIVSAALKNLQKTISDTQTDVKIISELPSLAVDRLQLIRVFQNLIGNAIKFRGKTLPEIRISAEYNDNLWTFCVADNGIGIEPRFYDRIFEIFKRLHTRDEYPGSGIGLSVSRKIIERHGGRIWVESKPNQGSKFYFSIPEQSMYADTTRESPSALRTAS
jgi:light-regulated signal transduction histidine kinase (bacteriophytochrome)